MLKQVLVEIENLSDFRTEHRNTLPLIFQNIANQNSLNPNSGLSLPPQLDMKVKYLVYLLKAEQK